MRPQANFSLLIFEALPLLHIYILQWMSILIMASKKKIKALTPNFHVLTICVEDKFQHMHVVKQQRFCDYTYVEIIVIINRLARGYLISLLFE